MKMDNKMVFVFLLFMVAIVHNANSVSSTNADDENRIESTDRLTIVIDEGDDQHAAESAVKPQQHVEPTAAAATTETLAKAGDRRSGRQLYQPSFAAFQPVFPQRRAYRVTKKKPPRTKSGRRPRPHRRRPSGPPPPSGPAGRYRRLPGPVRAQQTNYVEPGPPSSVDYYDDADGFESGPPHQQQQSVVAVADYVEQRELDREPTYAAVMPSVPLTAGRARKRPAIGAYADEPQVVHVPVLRVVRPTVVPASTATAAAVIVDDPMEKLRQLVHEAMDEHFANRHQDLYSADGTFDNKQQRQHVFSAKYKRQPTADDKATDKAKATQADAVRSTTVGSGAKGGKDRVQFVSYATQPPPPSSDADADVDADGSDDRLTLAEISAYMGAKPAETVLSAGGHRYVLSDALQQSYRYNRQQQQQRQQEQQLQYNGDDLHHQYLRYVSPFEAMYELPAAARWAYR